MRARRYARGVAAVALCHAALSPAPHVAAAAVRPACTAVGVSPEFARDRVALCGRLHHDGTAMVLSVFRTRDGGRTWAPVRAAGLATTADAGFAIRFQFSPGYATDRRVFLATSAGLYATADLGESFTTVDATLSAAGFDNPAVYAGSTGALSPALPGPRVLAVAGLGARSARTDVATGTHQPVAGVVPGATKRFVVPTAVAPGAPVLALSTEQPDPAQPNVRYVVWRCTDDLVCAERRAELPLDYVPRQFVRLPLAGGRSVLAVIGARGNSYDLLLSSDDGATFRRWTSATAAIAPMARAMAPDAAPAVGLAFSPAKPGLLYLRVAGGLPLDATRWAASAPPAEQVFRSADGGATWRRVAYGRAFGQPGSRGGVPWNTTTPGVYTPDAAIALGADGRLLVPAAVEGASGIRSYGVYCSLDGGRRWYAACPR